MTQRSRCVNESPGCRGQCDQSKLLLRILNRLGINNVVVVDNGKAVDREAAEPFDVVLMDMRMPVMDGVEAVRSS
jgi:CheY-like chemotaxis protein